MESDKPTIIDGKSFTVPKTWLTEKVTCASNERANVI
jgi:hypothetical protein